MDDADIKYLQSMIEHHQAALDMSKKYLDETSPNTRQARVADLARGVIKAQTEEIATMRGWLRSEGGSGTSSMSM